MSIVCEACGKSFVRTVRESVAQFEKRKFCSRRCADAKRYPPALDRICARLVQGDGGCWLWTAGLTSRIEGCGYGALHQDGRYRVAHRVLYEELIGKVPPGLELDHLCRVRRCCNPNHLEPVTRQENGRRGIAGKVAAAKNKAKTHCLKGHPYSGDNLVIREKGWRGCRICRAGYEATRQRRRAHDGA